jgi:hypothetical protein
VSDQNVTLTKDGKFRMAADIRVDASTCEVSRSTDCRLIYIGDLTLDMAEAIFLRDWLNKVIPS